MLLLCTVEMCTAKSANNDPRKMVSNLQMPWHHLAHRRCAKLCPSTTSPDPNAPPPPPRAVVLNTDEASSPPPLVHVRSLGTQRCFLSSSSI